jgi:hypothetical protein
LQSKVSCPLGEHTLRLTAVPVDEEIPGMLRMGFVENKTTVDKKQRGISVTAISKFEWVPAPEKEEHVTVSELLVGEYGLSLESPAAVLFYPRLFTLHYTAYH